MKEIRFGAKGQLSLLQFKLHLSGRFGFIVGEVHLDDQILTAGRRWGFWAHLKVNVFCLYLLFVDNFVFWDGEDVECGEVCRIVVGPVLH